MVWNTAISSPPSTGSVAAMPGSIWVTGPMSSHLACMLRVLRGGADGGEVAVQVAAVARGALGPGIVLHELLRVAEPRREPLDGVGLGEQLPLEPLEALALDPRRGALEIVRVLAVELDERGAVLERFLLGGDLAQQVGHADLDPTIPPDMQLVSAVDADHPEVLDRRLGAVARAAADRDLELVRHPAAPRHLLDLDPEPGRILGTE